jgi:hypothetical protein
MIAFIGTSNDKLNCSLLRHPKLGWNAECASGVLTSGRSIELSTDLPPREEDKAER